MSGVGDGLDATLPSSSFTKVMDGNRSSNVKVEYYDPSGVFPLISPQLLARLPLRNLHWKSPTRPLRSIDSLHIDFVPCHDSPTASVEALEQLSDQGAANSSQNKAGTQTRQSNDVQSPSESNKGASRERRHQIPGLQQNPYLKIYLLRCDDNEAYKSSARKQIRDWMRINTPSSQSSSANAQENHDAFECFIVHVVLPDTPAASQPRWSGSSGSSSTTSVEKAGGTSRWPGRSSSTTIFEKIRADFNGSSKSSPDRVAQVRLSKEALSDRAQATASRPSVPSGGETSQDWEHAWNDLIAKMKTLILMSFDLRVSQYEEDIREKDSQRSLPGWNFCTFFLLKEGLAKGFESVGLVEDALVGYDELSIGLDSIIRDQAVEGHEGHGGVFPSHTEDLVEDLIAQSEGKPTSSRLCDKPINSARKNYRDQILSNDISVFDFKCYIFSRQMTLLLRLGSPQSTRSELLAKLQSPKSPPSTRQSRDDLSLANTPVPSGERLEDLGSLAELCGRAVSFITSTARDMRADLYQGARIKKIQNPDRLIDNIVSSWTYAVSQQVLHETATSSLPVSIGAKGENTDSSSKMRPFGGRMEESKVSVLEPKTMIHPARSTSLTNRRASLNEPPYAITPAGGRVVYEHGSFPSTPLPSKEIFAQGTAADLEELAAHRAELYLIQRRLIEHIGKAKGWRIGWAAIYASQSSQDGMVDISLNDPEPGISAAAAIGARETESFSNKGLMLDELTKAAEKIEAFRKRYEMLSDLAVRHFMASGRSKSSERILGDLAALKFEMEDFGAAAMYFSRMAPVFAQDRWTRVEMMMLKMYAKCLKKVQRKDDYATTLLDILARSAAKQRASATRFPLGQRGPVGRSMGIDTWLDDDKIGTSGYLTELLLSLEESARSISVPMTDFFGDILVEPYIRHYDDKDGFQLRVQFRHLLEDPLPVETVKVHLLSASANAGRDIWLENVTPFELRQGLARLWLDSNVTASETYVVDKIIVEAKQLIFIHEPIKSDATIPLDLMSAAPAVPSRISKGSRITCYPRIGSFRISIAQSPFIHIDQPRALRISCESGSNDIERAELRLRSGSAGLRLRTADVKVIDGSAAVQGDSTPGIIRVSQLPRNDSSTFQIQYELETNLAEVSIKVEATYLTPTGEFHLVSTIVLPVELSLDVNVLDQFKDDSLISKFNIRTANNVPLQVTDVDLEGTDQFSIGDAPIMGMPIFVFPKQPAVFTYRIRPKASKDGRRTSRIEAKEPPLALTVTYRCLDHDVLTYAEKRFGEDIARSPFGKLARLLIPSFVDRIKHRLVDQLEVVALTGRMRLGPFQDMSWDECLEGLPHPIRDEVRIWLEQWHQENDPLNLSGAMSDTVGKTEAARKIMISVPVPRIHVLHTVSLNISGLNQALAHSPPVAAVGEMLTAELRIQHTRRWDAESSLKKAFNISDPNAPLSFIYEIGANPDVWLIGGQRRTQFAAKENELLVFSVMLMPLRPGIWLLPTVDVRPILPRLDESSPHSTAPPSWYHHGRRDESLTMETDYRSHGETIQVIPDLRSTTIGVTQMAMPGEHAAGTVLLGSETVQAGSLVD